jgi:23S rRNA (cytosine1962-C5)-methyltransferase
MAELRTDPLLMVGEGWDAYRLVDSGSGRKLEAYGPHSFIRPEPQALWAPRLAEWDADGEFVPGSDEDGGGRWQFARPVPPDGWELGWNEQVRFTAQCTPFRHLGFFPDMAPVWEWMGSMLSPREGGDLVPQAPHSTEGGSRVGSSSQLRFRGDADLLNLFGYTGVGTLALSTRR